MERLNIGVVGVGHLGSLHAKMLAEMPDVHLVGVLDIDLDKARKVASEFATTAAENLDQLLCNTSALTIATSTQQVRSR